jgi:hypothetical protein
MPAEVAMSHAKKNPFANHGTARVLTLDELDSVAGGFIAALGEVALGAAARWAVGKAGSTAGMALLNKFDAFGHPGNQELPNGPGTAFPGDSFPAGFDPHNPTGATPQSVVNDDFHALGDNGTPQNVINDDFHALGDSATPQNVINDDFHALGDGAAPHNETNDDAHPQGGNDNFDAFHPTADNFGAFGESPVGQQDAPEPAGNDFADASSNASDFDSA